MTDPSIDLPPPGKPGRQEKLLPALERIARCYPRIWAPVVTTLSTVGSARVLASQLRKGARAAEGRPAGTWQFATRPVIEGPNAGKFAVWARVWPEGETPPGTGAGEPAPVPRR